MTVALFGILASLLSELISWVQKKLTGTPFQGSAAQIVIMIVSVVGAAIYFVYQNSPSINATTFVQYASSIYAISQVYYLAIGQWYATTKKQ